MAIVMNMEWDGVSPAEFDAVRERVNWDGDPMVGAHYHVAAFNDRGLHVTAVWDSAEQFDAFAQERLMPAVMAVGVQGEPRVEILPVHNIFAPARERSS